MENSGNEISEERVAALEMKVNKMNALVEGLTEELLDLKALNRQMPNQIQDHNLHGIKNTHFVVQDSPVNDAVIADEAAPQQQNTSTVVVSRPRAEETQSEPEMVMIMQNDGTRKLEPRRGNSNCSFPLAGQGGNKQKTMVKSKLTDFAK
ncbi:MAG: hypothetical protein WCE65_03755 [Methanoregula sp.]